MGLEMSLYHIDEYKNEADQLFYWNKANMIHNWFVQNIHNVHNNDVDKYQTRSLDYHELKILHDLCQTVIETPDKAKKLLPTLSGPAFGSTVYNEQYFKTVGMTLYLFDQTLPKYKDGDFFVYQSSW